MFLIVAGGDNYSHVRSFSIISQACSSRFPCGLFGTARPLIRFNPARGDVKILHTTDCWQTFLPSFCSFFLLLVFLGYVCWLLAACFTLLALVGHRHGHVLFMLSAICHHGKHKLYYHQNEKSFLALWHTEKYTFKHTHILHHTGTNPGGIFHTHPMPTVHKITANAGRARVVSTSKNLFDLQRDTISSLLDSFCSTFHLRASFLHSKAFEKA